MASALTGKHIGQVGMDQPYIMLRSSVTSDVIDDIKLEGVADRIDNVRGQRDTLKFGDIRQGGTIYCVDDIKEEGEPPNPENTRESFISDSGDIKVEDIYDYVCDIKGEGISQNVDNSERILTCDSIDIKVEDTYDDISDIKEEDVSQNMDLVGENYSCNNIDIKVEDRDVCMDDTNIEDMSYRHDVIEQQDLETERRENTGSLFLLYLHAIMERFDDIISLQVYCFYNHLSF